VSFTKFVTSRLAGLCGIGELRNISAFMLLIVLNYLILALWSPLTTVVKQSIVLFSLFQLQVDAPKFVIVFTATHDTITREVFGNHVYFQNFKLNNINDLFMAKMPIDFFAFSLLPLCPSLVRFFISVIFVCSFLLRPLVMRPVNLVWRRIVESEKPVFTLTFGGTAAFATAITEAAKHL
jgi:hypothetical protein